MAFTNFIFFFFALFLTMGHLAPQASARPLHQEKVSLSMRERHEQWMAKHGRVYKDIDEKEKRLRIFKENIERIDVFNNNASNHKSFKLGANAFTDLTNEEFAATHKGFNPQTPSNLPNFGSNMHMEAHEFPSYNLTEASDSIDWRDLGAVTPVKDQQNCGCCWAFSTVAAVEGKYQIQTGTLLSFSEQQLLDCTTSTCESGGFMTDAFTYLVHNGLQTEANYQYIGAKGQCREESGGVMITGYIQVPQDPSALKRAVSQQPVSIAIDASSFEFMNYRGGIFNQGCGTTFDHAVTLIGYGTDEQSGQEYWLIKNSWGTTWGEEGYMRLLMDENLCPITGHASYPRAIRSE